MKKCVKRGVSVIFVHRAWEGRGTGYAGHRSTWFVHVCEHGRTCTVHVFVHAVLDRVQLVRPCECYTPQAVLIKYSVDLGLYLAFYNP